MHNHSYEITKNNETKTLFVIILTVITMILEIAYGYITNSMALLADGYHMGTHVFAFGLTYAAYVLIRKYKDSPLFPNGTDKIGILAAYTSALFLAFTGVWIIYEAVQRFINPISINFNDAIIVAVVGFIVNVLCIIIMNNSHEHCHEEIEDYNYKSAYYHILADILTSVFAIFALILGKFFGIVYLDIFVGIVGGIIILRWAVNLIRETVANLIDMKK